MLENFRKYFSGMKENFNNIDISRNDIRSVTRKDIENLMQVINSAKNCCDFEIELGLRNGMFFLDSQSFDDMRIIDMDGKHPESISITYSDDVSKTDYTVPIRNISSIYCNLVFVNQGEE